VLLTALPSASAAVIVVVLAAGFAHAVWNAMAKGLGDPLVTFAFINLAATGFGLVLLLSAGWPGAACAWYLALSVLLHLGYQGFLLRSYQVGEFSQVYPLARGVAPLLVSGFSALALGEHLGLIGSCGVLAVAVGVGVLAGPFWRSGRRGVEAALLTGVFIAAYTIADGLGVRHAHGVVGYAGLLFLLQGPVFPLVARLRLGPRWWPERREIAAGLAAGGISVLAYGAVLWAQTRANLGVVSALRETGVLWGAAIGTWWFHERFGPRRLVAAAVVVSGITLLAL